MPEDNKISVSAESLLSALRHAMQTGASEERHKIAAEVEAMIHEDMPGGYIVLLRRVRDEILIGRLDHEVQ